MRRKVGNIVCAASLVIMRELVRVIWKRHDPVGLGDDGGLEMNEERDLSMSSVPAEEFIAEALHNLTACSFNVCAPEAMQNCLKRRAILATITPLMLRDLPSRKPAQLSSIAC